MHQQTRDASVSQVLHLLLLLQWLLQLLLLLLLQ